MKEQLTFGWFATKSWGKVSSQSSIKNYQELNISLKNLLYINFSDKLIMCTSLVLWPDLQIKKKTIRNLIFQAK